MKRSNSILIIKTLGLGLSLSFAQAQQTQEAYQAFTGDGFGQWKNEGDAFGQAPTAGGQGKLANKIFGYVEPDLAASYNKGDVGVGSLTSPKFTINSPYLAFLIGGSKSANAGIQLLVDEKVVLEARGEDSNTLQEVVWNLKKYRGKTARIKIYDEDKDGYILIDEITFSKKSKGNFPKRVFAKSEVNKLVASKAAPTIKVPEGVKLQVFADAKRHGVTSPTALTIDEKGEVFVTETLRFKDNFGIDDNRHRRHWIPEDLAAQTTSDRMEMYKRWYHKHPESFYTSKAERVRRLADTNNDGVTDKAAVFADSFNDHLDGTAAGIYAMNGTVYFACIPHIWALKDKDGDGKISKTERTSLQEGFGVRVSFSGHDLNGFVPGPDGRIYCTVGDRGFNIKTKERRHYKYPGQGAVIRFDPDGSNMEVVHIGLRNPKEFSFDQWGNAISVDNNADQGDKARVVLYVEGADSGWRMGHQILHSFHKSAGLEERPINRWKQDRMWEPRNDQQPAFFLPPLSNLTSGPSGLTYYPGSGFIDSFKIAQNGANMKVSANDKFSWGFAVTDIDYGYDGKLYATDFIGGWTTHSKGAVLSYASTDPKSQAEGKKLAAIFAKGFEELESSVLEAYLDHGDMRVRQRSQFELAKSLSDFIPTRTQNLLESAHG